MPSPPGRSWFSGLLSSVAPEVSLFAFTTKPFFGLTVCGSSANGSDR